MTSWWTHKLDITLVALSHSVFITKHTFTCLVSITIGLVMVNCHSHSQLAYRKNLYFEDFCSEYFASVPFLFAVAAIYFNFSLSIKSNSKDYCWHAKKLSIFERNIDQHIKILWNAQTWRTIPKTGFIFSIDNSQRKRTTNVQKFAKLCQQNVVRKNTKYSWPKQSKYFQKNRLKSYLQWVMSD